MAGVEVIEADLAIAEHQQAIVGMLNDYAQDPIITGKPLPEKVQANVIAGLQEIPTTTVLLAILGDQAVGIAVCFLGFSTFAAKPLLNIHDLAVSKDFRGQGIGSKLLAGVEGKARRLGCCKITLEVHENNGPARSAYQSAGFHPTGEDSSERQSFFLTKTLPTFN